MIGDYIKIIMVMPMISHEPFVDLNGNGLYDPDVRKVIDIFGTLVLLDFGLDGIPALDANEDGDYDDDGMSLLMQMEQREMGLGW
ncbi:MAG: hypothetical protein CM15mP127_14290 [Gammaproteobacteria bacterium]|nr:MAG: hypothetical protein CM15mP127_14290 [Gammaproteobacteria bacterium]